MTEKLEYIYRYRSIDKLFKYKELENLEIYFSKPSELNDKMEEYMNIVWKGDEIAFQCMLKHYIYSLYHLYAIASIINSSEKLDRNNLPIFLSYESLSYPEMETLFKDIFDEFFSSSEIARIPKIMSESQKTFNQDEIGFILKSIHLYAYLVINTLVKKHIYQNDLLKSKEYATIYNHLKTTAHYTELLKIITNSKDKEKIALLMNFSEYTHKEIKKALHIKFFDKNKYNIELLTFDFTELYIQQLKRLLYDEHYIACFTNSFNNKLMWGHYANGGNGVCLKYKTKTKNLKNNIDLYISNGISFGLKETIATKNYVSYEIHKVNYSDNYPEIDFFNSLGCIPMSVIDGFWLCNYDKTKFSKCIENYKNMDCWRTEYHKKAVEYICTKSKEWDYEEEYRVFTRDTFSLFTNDEDRKAKYKFEDLEAIIFGQKVSDKDKNKIIQIINRHCENTNREDFKFYDLYYSTMTKQLELKPYI